MTNSFAAVALNKAGCFRDPDKPDKTHTFEQQRQIASCIDRLLTRSESTPGFDGLRAELLGAAGVLAADNPPPLASLIGALKAIAEKFENFLQLVAAIKYSERPEILTATDSHCGFLGSSLGGLLLGSPDPKPGISDDQKAAIPKARIVQFSFGGKDLACRALERTRKIRNEVHAAARVDALETLERARIVFAAYLFATEQNLAVLSRGLFEHRATLERLIERCKTQAPIFVPTGLKPARSEEGKSRRHEDGLDSVEALAMRGAHRETTLHVVLLGEPGAGKSTLVHELARRQAEAVIESPFSDLRIPVLIEASRVTDRDDPVSLAALELECTEPELTSLAADGRVLFLFDGLNEVPVRLVADAKSKIRNLAARYPTSALVVTSRFHAVTDELKFTQLQLEGFTAEQVLQYLGRAFADATRAEQFFGELRDIPRLFELCRNPLLLWMLADLSRDQFRIPTNRGRLLRDFLERFLERERSVLAPIEPYSVHRILARVAYAMRCEGGVTASRDRVLGWIAENLETIQTRVGVVDIYRAALNARLLRESRQGHVAFFHELIQEYFAAEELVRLYAEDPQVLNTEGFRNASWWREVLVIFYGLVEQQDQLLSAISEQNVAVSAACVMDAIAPDPRQQSTVVLKAGALLSDSSSGSTPQAFEALALVWTDSARRCLLDSTTTTQQLRDFLGRFSSDTLSAATDLLQTELSLHTVRAVADALKTTNAGQLSQEATERLGVTLVAIIGENPGGLRKLDLRSSLRRLIKYARLPADSAVRNSATASLRRGLLRGMRDLVVPLAARMQLLGEFPAFDYEMVIACLQTQEDQQDHLTELLPHVLSNVRLPEAARQEVVGRLLVARRLREVQSVIQALSDRTWLRPFMPLLAEDLLRQGESVASVRVALEAVLRPDEIGLVVRQLVDRFELPTGQLRAALSLIGDPAHSRQILLNYLEHFLDIEAFEQVWRVLKLIPRGHLASERFRPVVSALHAKNQLWLALDLLFKLRAQDEFSQLIAEGVQQVRDWLAGSAETGMLQRACGWVWAHLPSEVQGAILDRVMGGRISVQTFVSWFRPARAALSRAIVAAEDKGQRVCVDLQAARRLGIEAPLRRTRQQDAEKALSGAGGASTSYMDGWSIALPASVSVDRERIRNGAAEYQELAIAFRGGHVLDSDVAEWFASRVENGDVDNALRVLALNLRNKLKPRAVLTVRTLLDRGDGVAAAQVVLAFELARDFLHEIAELVPELLAAGRIGIASSLSKALGPSYAPEFSGEILRATQAALERGDAPRASRLMTQCGLSMLDREFEKLTVQVFAELLERRNEAALQAMLDDHHVAELLDHDACAAVLRTGKVSVVAAVRQQDIARNFYIVALPHKWGSAILFPGRGSGDVKIGASVRVWLKPNKSKKKRFEVIRFEGAATSIGADPSLSHSQVPEPGAAGAETQEQASIDDSTSRFVEAIGRRAFAEASAILAAREQQSPVVPVELRDCVRQFFSAAVAEGRFVEAEEVLVVHPLTNLLERGAVRDVLRHGLMWVTGRVSRLDLRNFAIVDLPCGIGSAILHGSLDPDGFGKLQEGLMIAVQLGENTSSPGRPDRFSVRAFDFASEAESPTRPPIGATSEKPQPVGGIAATALAGSPIPRNGDDRSGTSPSDRSRSGRPQVMRAETRPINTGQVRVGTLCLDDNRHLAVRFDADERVAFLENPWIVSGGPEAAGRAAEFYIRRASRREGIIARFERFVTDGGRE